MKSNETGHDFPDELENEHWSQDHMDHVIELREKALDFGRKLGTDYLLVSTSKNIPLYYSIARLLI